MVAATAAYGWAAPLNLTHSLSSFAGSKSRVIFGPQLRTPGLNLELRNITTRKLWLHLMTPCSGSERKI